MTLLPLSCRDLVIPRTPHVRVDRSTESRKGDAAPGSSLWPGIPRENATSEAPCSRAVVEIVLGPDALDAALDTREERAHLSEVARHAPRPRSHILEADFQLLSQRERADRCCCSAGNCCVEGGIVGHLFGGFSVSREKKNKTVQ